MGANPNQAASMLCRHNERKLSALEATAGTVSVPSSSSTQVQGSFRTQPLETQRRGRNLEWGWCLRFWDCSPPPPPAVWEATGDCPWICRQGWFWQTQGKPACCPETYNSGSPFDECQNGS